MEGISIKLPPSLSSALSAEARRRNVTRSLIVREALERLLHRQDRAKAPSCADLIEDLAGSIKSGRRDLATNKALLQAAVEAHSMRGRKRRR